MLRQKAKGHWLGEVEFQIGTGPLQGIVRQGTSFSQFCQPVPDRIEVPAGGIFGGKWITGQNRVNDPSMRLKQNRQVRPATNDGIEMEPGNCIGGCPPGLSQPRHISKPDNRFMKLPVGYGHAAVVSCPSRPLET